MKVKYLFLPVALILTTGLALAQQGTPVPSPDQKDDGVENTFSFLINGGGFLGVHAEDISRENLSRYHLGQVRGVGVTQVVKDSPAEKAGLRKDDVILRIDGENVTSVRKLNRVVSEIAPEQSVRINISRGGSEQELTATIAKRNTPSMTRGLLSEDPKVWKWEGPLTERNKLFKEGENFNLFRDGDNFSFAFANGRRIGVSTMQLTKQLADYFGIADGKGVLITSVSDDGPAAKAGLKAGDVITAIDGESIDSSGDVSRIINKKKEGDVNITVIRNKSSQSIRVQPKEGEGFTNIIGPTTVGRRIVIPRIQIPDIHTAMPQIDIPSIPAINVNLPSIRVNPRVRVIRRTTDPI
jgi:serine protease Do